MDQPCLTNNNNNNNNNNREEHKLHHRLGYFVCGIFKVRYSRFMGGFEACIVGKDNSTKHRIKEVLQLQPIFIFLQRDLIKIYTGIIYEFVFNEILLNILCYLELFVLEF